VRAAHADARLEAIAGAPAATLVGVGSADTGFAPLQERTLVAVLTGAPGMGQSFVRFGSSTAGTSRIRIVRHATAPSVFAVGAYMAPAELSQEMNLATSQVVGVLVLRVRATSFTLDAPGARGSRAFSWGDGFTDPRLIVEASACAWAGAWPRALSDGEVARIIAWLAWRYETPPPRPEPCLGARLHPAEWRWAA
jgi:hypothetical protein